MKWEYKVEVGTIRKGMICFRMSMLDLTASEEFLSWRGLQSLVTLTGDFPQVLVSAS